MSTRGRGRGGGAKPNDRNSSSSSATSSRSASLTRPTTSTTTTTTTQDTDKLMKQLTNKLGAGTGTGASARPTPKFTPNLTVLKKDKTDSPVNISPSSSNNDLLSMNRRDNFNGNRGHNPRGGGGYGRGAHNNRGNFVQMEGIFQGNAQIPTSSAASSSSSSRMSSIKRENSALNTRMPNIKKLGSAKTLIGDVDGLKYEIDEEYEPRQIPIAERRSVFDVKKEPGQNQKIKEPISTSSKHIDSFIELFTQQKLQTSTKSIVKDEPIEPTDIPKSDEPIFDPSQLILMQFPDVLPCTRTSSSSTKPELTSLSDLPDGFLGKLQIYKSGKCRLKLNDDTYLDVDIGQPTSFLQNVMVTEMASTNNNNTTEHGTNNDMNKLVCLGDIKHKLIVSLDVDHVLQDTRQ
ncbi:unnamed protein product [Adineta steineri]|uniref:DNA-directed RNA polymerase III subunit RPC4 n=1 Tax=Adineta steineri TaxID=433720 RepID=A0A813Q685_9BILA|nr:unnamed protein product [Adineta steineri]CAF3665999.1 unnamed protein product [Adineta steineri]